MSDKYRHSNYPRGLFAPETPSKPSKQSKESKVFVADLRAQIRAGTPPKAALKEARKLEAARTAQASAKAKK